MDSFSCSSPALRFPSPLVGKVRPPKLLRRRAGRGASPQFFLKTASSHMDRVADHIGGALLTFGAVGVPDRLLISGTHTPNREACMREPITRTLMQKFDVPNSAYETVIMVAEMAPQVNSGLHTEPSRRVRRQDAWQRARWRRQPAVTDVSSRISGACGRQ